MTTLKRIAQTVLTAIALGSLVALLGAPSLIASFGLMAAAYISVKGLQKLGTFDA